MLLLSNNNHNHDPTSTLCSTDANAHSSSPTSSTHAKDLITDQGTTVPPLTGTPRTTPSPLTSPSPKEKHLKKKNPEEGEGYQKRYIL
jgi:hypothetical protein